MTHQDFRKLTVGQRLGRLGHKGGVGTVTAMQDGDIEVTMESGEVLLFRRAQFQFDGTSGVGDMWKLEQPEPAK